MTMTKAEIDVPEEIVPYTVLEDKNAQITRNAMLLYPYIKSGVMSHGKAAEMMSTILLFIPSGRKSDYKHYHSNCLCIIPFFFAVMYISLNSLAILPPITTLYACTNPSDIITSSKGTSVACIIRGSLA